jgi:hypothetical protein
LTLSLGDLKSEIDGFKFGLRKISKLVNAQGIGVRWVGVVFLDLDKVSQEDIFSI